MKKITNRLSGLVFLLLTVFCVSCCGEPACAIEVSSAARGVVTKNVSCGGSVCFSETDFAGFEQEGELCVSSLPESSLGALTLNGDAAAVGSRVSSCDLDKLCFTAKDGAGLSAMFELKSPDERNIAVVVRVNGGTNYAPIAENITLSTYKNASVGGVFKSTDPEGDEVTYALTSAPRKGEVTVNGSSFVYTPFEGKGGSDSFTYSATDANGNVSECAEVSVRISGPKTDVVYSDMAGNRAHYAALRLAENNVLTGERLAGNYFFSPGATVSRGDFLAMCMRACSIENRDGITATAFSDDAVIDLWLKPYVSTALTENIVGGYKDENGAMVFSAETPITYAEAAVTLNNILKITDTEANAFVSREDVPAWAYQAAVNLSSVGIMPSCASVMGGGVLTRADAAELICASLDFVDARDGSSLLKWFR